MSSSFDIEQVYRIKVEDSHSTSHNDSSTALRSEPSFSIYNNTLNQDSEDDNELAISALSEALGTEEFTFGKKMGLIEEEKEEEMEVEKIDKLSGFFENFEIGGGGHDIPLLGLAGAGRVENFDGNEDLSDYYRRILKEEPSNPLSLSSYAQLLQRQGDLSGTEEYYYRATLANPNDGVILMQYAKLIWEFHHDQDKASIYFEKAVSAASDDSHVQAEYARFLWEIDESEEEDDDNISANTRTPIGTDDSITEEQQIQVSSPLHLAIGLELGASGLGNGLSLDNIAAASSEEKGYIEDHYKGMIVEDPRDILYLKNYAEFLYQSKGDLAGALEYYSRALLVDPSDWEIVSSYAELVWKVHHDKDKATTYFERAIQASPDNSNVLGAYARFLWEVEEDDE